MRIMKHQLVISFVLCIIQISSVLCQDTNSSTTQNVIEITTSKTSFSKKASFANQNGKIALSTLKPVETTVKPEEKTVKPSLEKSTRLICPGREIRRPLFTLPCATTKDCSVLGRGLLCCEGRCLKGLPAPKPEPVHAPTLFGLVPRGCPKEPLAELWEIKECKTDTECSPRICCPEKMTNGEFVGFCRTAEPVWDRVPRVAKQFMEPLRMLVSYMQCTPPPPPFLDIFPKACSSPLDCFPNLCCQERGKRFCRPPKRSLLTLVADVGQRLVPPDAARRLISRVTR